MTAIRIRAPASTANLGSGFDALAIALALHNEVAAEPAGIETLAVSGEGADVLRRGARNLVLAACDRALTELRCTRPPLRLRLYNGIPLGCGLGSSSAAIAAGLRLGERLAGEELGERRLLRLAYELEGHADNTTAALLGGCTVCAVAEGDVLAARVALPAELRLALFVPDYAVATAEARAVLPAQVPRADAVFNIGRAALLVAALQGNRPELLAAAMADRLHQPYRAHLYRGLNALFAAASAAGAWGVAVSGAGPSVAALAPANTVDAIAAALGQAAAAAGVNGRSLALAPDLAGTQVLDG